jgi:hypothetical protein
VKVSTTKESRKKTPGNLSISRLAKPRLWESQAANPQSSPPAPFQINSVTETCRAFQKESEPERPAGSGSLRCFGPQEGVLCLCALRAGPQSLQRPPWTAPAFARTGSPRPPGALRADGSHSQHSTPEKTLTAIPRCARRAGPAGCGQGPARWR